ncbi:MAG: hemerythrin domain-containing protein [Mycobacteriales bacterium]
MTPTSTDGSEPDTGRPTSGPATLRDEHALMLTEVTARTTDLLAEADQGRWPQQELQQLLDYLHLEVLRQVVDEEWLLFRNSHHDPQSLTPLREDHLELRRLVEILADVAADASRRSPAALAATTRELLTKLQTHIDSEEQLLGASDHEPSVGALGRTPHTWYPLTEGPLIDLDDLPGPQGADAVLGRLLRLRGGEQVDVRASSDPLPIWRRLASADPDCYGFDYQEQGPPRWRVRVTRRQHAG